MGPTRPSPMPMASAIPNPILPIDPTRAIFIPTLSPSISSASPSPPPTPPSPPFIPSIPPTSSASDPSPTIYNYINLVLDRLV